MTEDAHQRFYLAFTDPAEGAGDRTAVRAAHQVFRRQLEAEGVLVAGGPMLEGDSVATSGSGLAILRVDTLAEAETIMAADPFVAGGFRTCRIVPWRLQNGRL